jgi:hypothetical protein
MTRILDLRKALAVVATCAAVLVPATAAQADKPPAWEYNGHSEILPEYFQGVTSDDEKNLYFAGPTVGLYRTDYELREEARLPFAIPGPIFFGRGYSHIGDITWDRAEGGRILLPLECLNQMFCQRGAIGVSDPETLQWRYHVELDQSFIDKAMWAEASPNGKLLWTSSGSGDDLLAYDMSEINPANAWPDGPELQPVIRFEGAVPPNGITGATFYKHRLLLASARGQDFKVWSVDTSDGSRELLISRTIVGESEGLDVVKALDGVLHWMVTPFQTAGLPPTYGTGHSALLHFKSGTGVGPQF